MVKEVFMKDLSRIFKLVKPYWRRVAIAAALGIVISGLSAAIAWLMKSAIDEIIINKNDTFLVFMPIGVALVFLIKGGLTFAIQYLMKSAAMKMVIDLRCRLFNHILDLPMGYFSKNASGNLLSKVMNDVNALNGVLSLTLKDLFVESTTILALTGVALWRSWDLAIIALFALPCAFWGVARLGNRVKSISKRTQEKIALILEIISETLAGIKIIKAFNKQSDEKELFKRKNKDLYRENMRIVRTNQFARLIMEIFSGLGIASVLWYGGQLVRNDHITPGDFVSFVTAILLIFSPVKKISAVNMGIQKGRAPLERIYTVLSEEKEIEGTVELKKFQDKIKLQNVSFSYPSSSLKALNNLNLIIKKGEIIAIVGKSGSGKTTLVNMLPKFYLPSCGKISIDRHEITTLTNRSLRSLYGIVSQDVILFNSSILDNIKYGKPEASEKEVIKSAKAANAHGFIMEFPEAYETMVGERGVRLSGGQRQRLSIARAILKNPPILILDEATSSLDSESEMMIQSALENLMRNRTSIIIAHRLSTVRKADRILVLDKGNIVEIGVHEELLAKRGLYQRLYEIQFKENEVSEEA